MNKTIYLRDDEVQIWERARELSGDKLSPVIVEALRRYIAEKNALAKGFERLVVQYYQNDLPCKKAFWGRWIIPLDKPFQVSGDEDTRTYFGSVAQTAKGNIVVFERAEDGEDVGYQFGVFPSYEEGANDKRAFGYVLAEAIRREGVPIEELDI